MRVPLLPRAVRWTLALGLLALVAYLSLAPGPEVPGAGLLLVPGLGHALVYAGLAFALAYALARWDEPAWRKAGLVFAIAIAYGALMEVGQLFRPTRSFEAYDLAMNALGAAIGASWCFLERRLAYRRMPRPG